MYALDAHALEQLSFDLELPLLFSNLTVRLYDRTPSLARMHMRVP